jgi:hypothetical protein
LEPSSSPVFEPRESRVPLPTKADDAIERVLFIGYCAIVGAFLTWAPWDRSWERLSWLAPLGSLRLYLLDPWVRAAVSSFGALHLLWGLHDLDLMRRLGKPGAHTR